MLNTLHNISNENRGHANSEASDLSSSHRQDANIAEQRFINGQIFLTTKRNRVDRRSGRDLPNVVLQLFEFFAQVLLSNALLVHRPRRSIARERSAREENHRRCHLQHQGVLFKALENGDLKDGILGEEKVLVASLESTSGETSELSVG